LAGRIRPGWWTKKISSHMCRFETKLNARTTASLLAIFNGMKRRRSIAAPPDTPCAVSGVPSRTSAHMSQKHDTIIFRSRQTDCAKCLMKERCCPNTSFRKIARSVHEAARDVARRIATTPQYVCSRHERKKVEMLFAHLKRILRLDRLRLRGMSGANDEFTMAAAVQNLRRLAKLTSQGPPTTG
jgi:hypothetical protein